MHSLPRCLGAISRSLGSLSSPGSWDGARHGSDNNGAAATPRETRMGSLAPGTEHTSKPVSPADWWPLSVHCLSYMCIQARVCAS